MSLPETMLAAVWNGPDQLDLIQRSVPEVVPGALLIRVRACAICGSDLRILRSGNPRITAPRIIGHEVSGEVVAIGHGVSGFAIGDRVTTGADIPCGECEHCRSGRANCCDINYAVGYQFDGGFAEYMLVNPLIVKYGPIRMFSDALPYEHAALAEPLACCINGYERALYEPDAGGSVVVFGAGPIGLMLVMLGRAFGAKRIITIEPSAVRRAKALQLGAHIALDPENEDVVANVLAATGGSGAQAIFTACPSATSHEQAIAMVGKRGVVNLFGGLAKTAPAISLLSNHLHYREAYITGSHGSTPAHHKRALAMIEENEIDVAPLIAESVPLAEIHRGFALAGSGGPGKIVVCP